MGRSRPTQVAPPVDADRASGVFPSLVVAANSHRGRLLILGHPGSGKSVALRELAQVFVAAGVLPIRLDLEDFSEKQAQLEEATASDAAAAAWRDAFEGWLVEGCLALPFEKRRGGILLSDDEARDEVRGWLREHDVALLLDGLDELRPAEARLRVAHGLNATWLRDRPTQAVIVTCRVQEYEDIGVDLALEGAVQVQAPTAAQVHAFLAAADAPHVEAAIDDGTPLDVLSKLPLTLGILAKLDRELLAPLRASTSDEADVRRALFDAYTDQLLQSDSWRRTDHGAAARSRCFLGWLAARASRGRFPTVRSVWSAVFSSDAPARIRGDVAAILIGLFTLTVGWSALLGARELTVTNALLVVGAAGLAATGGRIVHRGTVHWRRQARSARRTMFFLMIGSGLGVIVGIAALSQLLRLATGLDSYLASSALLAAILPVLPWLRTQWLARVVAAMLAPVLPAAALIHTWMYTDTSVATGLWILAGSWAIVGVGVTAVGTYFMLGMGLVSITPVGALALALAVCSTVIVLPIGLHEVAQLPTQWPMGFVVALYSLRLSGHSFSPRASPELGMWLERATGGGLGLVVGATLGGSPGALAGMFVGALPWSLVVPALGNLTSWSSPQTWLALWVLGVAPLRPRRFLEDAARIGLLVRRGNRFAFPHALLLAHHADHYGRLATDEG